MFALATFFVVLAAQFAYSSHRYLGAVERYRLAVRDHRRRLERMTLLASKLESYSRYLIRLEAEAERRNHYGQS